MKRLIFFLACLVSFQYAHSQSATQIKSLNVGDSFPKNIFNTITDFQRSDSVKSNLNEKLVILDFWATWCTGCLYGFPKLDSLQIKYPKQLAVVLVNTKSTGDTDEKVERLLGKMRTPSGRPYTFPNVMYDTVLTRYFKHKMLPHYVWLYDGKVKAITSAEEVTGPNIEAIYSHQPLNMRTKSDVMDFDRTKPLFQNGNGGNGESVMYKTILTKYVDGLSSGSSKSDSNGLVTRLTITNAPILQLYQRAYQTYLPKDQIIIQSNHPEKFHNYSDWSEWKYDNTFCYEAIVPPMSWDKLYKKMREDLKMYFEYEGKVEICDRKKFVLTPKFSL